MLKNKHRAGFTILEVLFVIVVIGILASLVLIAYRGIQDNAKETIIKQGLTKSGLRLETYRAGSGTDLYPDSLADAEISGSEGNTLSYNVSTDHTSYCLSSTNGTKVFFITNTNTNPAPGICNGSSGTPGTGNIADDTTPDAVTVVASTTALKFSWADISCLAGMTPSYRWSWQIAGGGAGEQASWSTTREQEVNVEGAKVTGTVYARCNAGGNSSNETSSTFDITLPILSSPTLAAISIASDSAASWGAASGCPSGTSPEYQWRRDTAREAGGYNSYSAWSTATSTSATIGYDDQVTYQVQGRCVRSSTGVTGPAVSRTSSTFTRGIPAPAAPGWGQHVVSNNLTMWWYATSCSAGYPVYHMWIIRRSTGAVQWDPGYTTATSVQRPSLPVASWDSHLQAYCQGTYTSSGWSGDNVAKTA